MLRTDASVIIPVRSGSKEIKDKNLQLIGSMTLVEKAVKTASAVDIVDGVYLAIDSGPTGDYCRALFASAKYPKLRLFERSEQSASDEAPTELVMTEWVSALRGEKAKDHLLILIQATSPFLETKHLEKGITLVKESGKDVLSVKRNSIFMWDSAGNPINYSPVQRPRRQDWNGLLVETGAFYITSLKKYSLSFCRITPPCEFVEMEEIESIDIDSTFDLAVANMIFETKKMDSKN